MNRQKKEEALRRTTDDSIDDWCISIILRMWGYWLLDMAH